MTEVIVGEPSDRFSVSRPGLDRNRAFDHLVILLCNKFQLIALSMIGCQLDNRQLCGFRAVIFFSANTF